MPGMAIRTGGVDTGGVHTGGAMNRSPDAISLPEPFLHSAPAQRTGSILVAAKQARLTAA